MSIGEAKFLLCEGCGALHSSSKRTSCAGHCDVNCGHRSRCLEKLTSNNSCYKGRCETCLNEQQLMQTPHLQRAA